MSEAVANAGEAVKRDGVLCAAAFAAEPEPEPEPAPALGGAGLC